LAEEGIKMVVTNIVATHQHQNRHLEVQPDNKPITFGLLKHLMISLARSKSPDLQKNIKHIQYFKKSNDIKQPAYLHFSIILSSFYSVFTGKSEEVKIKNNDY
jgi:hypothetical protein